MNTFFNPQDILGIGYSMAAQASTAAWTIFGVTSIVAFALALARHSAGGPAPFGVILQIFAIALALGFYSSITSIINGLGQTAATSVGQGGNFTALLNSFQSDVDTKFKADPVKDSSQSGWDKALDAVASFGIGTLSGILSVLGTLAVIIALHLYQILQAVLYGVLVAVGPIVLAVSIVPGGGSIRSRWFMALFELAMWPVIGSVIFEMLGKAFMTMRSGQSKDFVSLFVSNIVLVFCVFLVPKIAARLVGSGFGAIGDAIAATTLGAASGAAGAAAGLGVAGIAKAAPHLASAAGSAVDGLHSAISGPSPYQPPAEGGPGGTFSTGPTMREREGNPDAAPVTPGPHAPDETPHDPTERNHPVDAASFNPQVEADERGGGPTQKNGKAGGRGLANSVQPMGDGDDEAGKGKAPRAVSMHVGKKRNEDFQKKFPGGQFKEGIYWSPDKVRKLKSEGKW